MLVDLLCSLPALRDSRNPIYHHSANDIKSDESPNYSEISPSFTELCGYALQERIRAT